MSTPADAMTRTQSRLLLALPGPSYAGHLQAHGPVPGAAYGPAFVDAVEAAGLTGRGGAAFPTHRKLRAVAGGRRAVVIGNGSETEPASGKDRVLLVHAPHLVLDGVQLAAAAVGADRAYLYIARDAVVLDAVRSALAERHQRRADRVTVEVVPAPGRFVAGQETAAVSRVGGGPAVPRFRVPPVYETGVKGRPTLVQNVETLAHLALIARHGASWFRATGTAQQPGTMLFTVAGAVVQPGVVEAPVGVTVRAVVEAAGGVTRSPGAVLVGGYHGTWLPVPQAFEVPLADEQAGAHGAAVGAGVVAVLPADRCGLVETARVVRYLADESAGQCGPCINGLPAMTGALEQLAGLRAPDQARRDVARWADVVVGRGACAHPDGTARFVRSALRTFEHELVRHASGRCSGTSVRAVLPVPDRRVGGWS